jgi:predicted ATP-dependent endonuclease of OLD family
MISLFAKLFLYDGKKIVLIDEPELSLSIDWQRDILVDVLSAESCDQAIAITHSPFIFDNSLEPYARSLELSVNLDKIAIEDGGDLV